MTEPRAPFEPLAVVAIVLAFFGPVALGVPALAAIGCGMVARRRIRRHDRRGETLALAAIVAGSVWLAMLALTLVVVRILAV